MLRALGASRRVVLRVVLIEGLALLALPLSLAVCRVVGSVGLRTSVPLVWSAPASLGWIALATVVAVLACVGPTRAALRPAVRWSSGRASRPGRSRCRPTRQRAAVEAVHGGRG